MIPTEQRPAFTAAPPSDVADRIAVMRIQEETTYKCLDYFGGEAVGGGHEQAVQSAISSSGPQQAMASSEHQQPTDKPSGRVTDAVCRTKMVEWCDQVVDFCKFNRETVSVAMSYVDRYLSTYTPSARRALSDRKEYQLVSMTSLFVAVKLHEPLEMDTALVSDLSRGCYTAEEVACMERELLQVLGWRVCGPTNLSFVCTLLELLPPRHGGDGCVVGETLLDISRFQAELASREYRFVGTNPSTVAVSAILNALEAICFDAFGQVERQQFIKSITQATRIDMFSDKVRDCRSRLMESFVRNSGYEMSQIARQLSSSLAPSKNAKAMHAEESPVTVVNASA